MPTKLLGIDACINRNTGSYGSPAWSNIWRIRGIKENRAPAAVVPSGTREIQKTSGLPTRYNLSWDADALWDKGTGLTALRTAFLARSVIDLAVLDRAATGSGTGYRGEMAVCKFNLDFPLLGEQKLDFSVKPHANHASGQGIGTYTDATSSAGTAESSGTKRLGNTASVNNSSGAALTAVRDWKLMLEWEEADGSDRADAFTKVLLTRMKISAEISFIWDSTDTKLTAIRTAFQAHSALDLFLLDDAYATTGAWGVHADWAVTDWSKDDPLEDGQKVTVKLEPHGNPTTAPTIVTI